MVINSVVSALSEAAGLDEARVRQDLEVPPEVGMGDYAYPCYTLASEHGSDPSSLADDLADTVSHGDIAWCTSQGPYVNIRLRAEAKLAADLVAKPSLGSDTIIVESPSPNTNKPLHLGHALNMVLGQAVANILSSVDHDVIKENLYNDRGIHISKSMLAYDKAGRPDTPGSRDQKPDHFVGEYYAAYNDLVEEDPSIEDEAQAMLRAWERGDDEVRSLWSTMRSWCLSGIKQTLDDYGIRVDKDRFESNTYQGGRDIVHDGLDKGVFEEKDDGSIVADLSDDGLGEKHVLRSDGTTVYITQDLNLAKTRAEETSPDRIVHVVGKEQEYHFDCLFTVLNKLGYDFADKLHHLSYGHVRLPEGAMSSREGTAVSADDVLEEMTELAREEILDRHDGLNDVEHRADRIGMAALKFFLLRTDPMHDITFDPDASLSFTGETGPYLQYTHARINSMIDGEQERTTSVAGLDSEEANQVLRELIQYEDYVATAARQYDPSTIANYALRLAQAYNEFYHEHTVLVDDDAVRESRVAVSRRTAQVLDDALGLLGIDTVEAM